MAKYKHSVSLFEQTGQGGHLQFNKEFSPNPLLSKSLLTPSLLQVLKHHPHYPFIYIHTYINCHLSINKSM